MKRQCPDCFSEFVYKDAYKFKLACELNKPCQKCACKRRRKYPETKVRNCPSCGRILEYPTVNDRNNAEYRNRRCLYCSNSGENNPMSGKNHSDDTRIRIKNSNIKTFRSRKIIGHNHGVNVEACKILDDIAKERGWNLKHALNGGEYQILNYFVDGFDEKLNIVLEYDEPRHYSRGELKIDDLKRMNEIIKFQKCSFFRYNEKTGEMKRYF